MISFTAEKQKEKCCVRKSSSAFAWSAGWRRTSLPKTKSRPKPVGRVCRLEIGDTAGWKPARRRTGRTSSTALIRRWKAGKNLLAFARGSARILAVPRKPSAIGYETRTSSDRNKQSQFVCNHRQPVSCNQHGEAARQLYRLISP